MSLVQAGVMKWTPKVRSVRLKCLPVLFHQWICIVIIFHHIVIIVVVLNIAMVCRETLPKLLLLWQHAKLVSLRISPVAWNKQELS